jgi:hypothetical protein
MNNNKPLKPIVNESNDDHPSNDKFLQKQENERYKMFTGKKFDGIIDNTKVVPNINKQENCSFHSGTKYKEIIKRKNKEGIKNKSQINPKNESDSSTITLKVDNAKYDQIIKEDKIIGAEKEPIHLRMSKFNFPPMKCHLTNDIKMRIELSFNKAKTDSDRIGLINGPINKKTQSKFEKKQNILLYW